MRTNPGQRGAVFGEISPRLEGRDNLDQYFESLRVCRNYIITPQGAILRRSGTRLVRADSPVQNAERIVPFTALDGAVVALVFRADGTGRVYTMATDPDSASIVTFNHSYASAEQLAELEYAQIGTLLYLAQRNHTPHVLRDTSGAATAFVEEAVVWRNGRQPMILNNLKADWTYTISGSSPNFTLTQAGAGIDRVFTAADIGRYVRLANGSVQRWFEITAYTSANVVTVQVRDGVATAPFTTATDDWSLGAFTPTSGPRYVTLHEGRLFYAAPDGAVDRVWASNSDDFNFFEERAANGDVTDNMAFTRRAVSRGRNLIQWMISASDSLGVGTDVGEYVLSATEDSILTPSSARLQLSTRRGSDRVTPEIVDGDIVFVQRGASQLRRLAYQLTDDRFASNDLTILAPHVTRAGVQRLAYQQAPDTILWALMSDGTLVGCTVEREQRVVAFHTHQIAGFFSDRAARVLDVAILPGDGRDTLWLLVERRDGGTILRSVERLEPTFDPAVNALSTLQDRINAVEAAWFVDAGVERTQAFDILAATQAAPCQLTVASTTGLTTGDQVRIRDMQRMTSLNRRTFTITVTGATTLTLDGSDTSASEPYEGGGAAYLEQTEVTGLSHLTGYEVAVFADGAERPRVVVEDGTITLDSPASIIRVGRPFKSVGLTQRFVAQGGLGSLSGQLSRVQRVVMRLLNTVGMRLGYGAQPQFLEEIEFRQLPSIMDEPLPLFSGDRDVSAAAEYSRDPSVYFEQDTPLPGGVLAIFTRLEANER